MKRLVIGTSGATGAIYGIRIFEITKEMADVETHLVLAGAGVMIHPPIPAFYNKPRSVDDIVSFTVGRALGQFDLGCDLFKPWEGAGRAAD